MPHHPFPTRPPGICGAVHPSSRPEEALFPFPESELLHASADGKAALGLTLRPPRERLGVFASATADMASIGISMGAFYDASLLETQPHNAAAVLDAPMTHCNGLFLAAGYADGKLTVVTSPYGSYPLYYMLQDGALLFSTSIQDLLRCMNPPPRHRPAGVAQWLLIERCVDGGTVWEGINRFQAASVYTFDTGSGALTSQRYWRLQFGEESSRAAVEQASEALVAAIRRVADRGTGNVAAALTGGLDSRIIWSVLVKDYPEIEAATHYMVDGTDITIARQVAQKLGIRHHACRIGEEFTGAFRESLKHMLLATNGLPSAENAHQPHIYDYHVPWTDTLIDGINASLERNISMRRIVSVDASEEELIDRTYHWLLHAGIVPLLRPEYQAEYQSFTRSAIADTYAQCDSGVPPKLRADEYYVRFMEPNYRNDLALMQFYYNQFTAPFFDLHYTNTITRLREDVRASQAVQDMLLKQFAPELLRMPRSHTDVRTLPVKDWRLQLAPLAWDRYFGKRLEAVVPRKLKPYTRFRRPSMVMEGVFREYLATNLPDLLAGLPYFFDPDAVERFLTQYRSGAHANTPVVGRLIAMSSPWSLLTLDTKQ